MNDQEVIRKAVELADGLYLQLVYKAHKYQPEDQYALVDGEGHTIFPSVKNKFARDIIAAQLARQVDALDDEVFAFVTRPGESVIYIWDSSIKNDNRIVVHGPDRTMNTLRAIVESKVLE